MRRYKEMKEKFKGKKENGKPRDPHPSNGNSNGKMVSQNHINSNEQIGSHTNLKPGNDLF